MTAAMAAAAVSNHGGGGGGEGGGIRRKGRGRRKGGKEGGGREGIEEKWPRYGMTTYIYTRYTLPETSRCLVRLLVDCLC